MKDVLQKNYQLVEESDSETSSLSGSSVMLSRNYELRRKPTYHCFNLMK